MIRREGVASEGTAGRWVLISQVDHARLAASLAEYWGSGGFLPLQPRDEVLWAVEHHDDGWLEWEQAPRVDPQRGVPRAFTEMELAASLEIWTASIEGARRAGNLQGYLVASHFSAIARRSAPWRQHDPLWPRAEAFLTHYGAEAARWCAAWQAENPASNTAELAQQGLKQLQFFDSLSLWFCCAAANDPEQAPSPGGPVLTLVPAGPGHIQLGPWPLGVTNLEVAVPGRAVPAVPYRDTAQLAAAPSQPLQLRWQLERLPGER